MQIIWWIFYHAGKSFSVCCINFAISSNLFKFIHRVPYFIVCQIFVICCVNCNVFVRISLTKIFTHAKKVVDFSARFKDVLDLYSNVIVIEFWVSRCFRKTLVVTVEARNKMQRGQKKNEHTQEIRTHSSDISANEIKHPLTCDECAP